jgi:hypothetical protein
VIGLERRPIANPMIATDFASFPTALLIEYLITPVQLMLLLGTF